MSRPRSVQGTRASLTPRHVPRRDAVDSASTALLGILVATLVIALGFTAGITIMGLESGSASTRSHDAELKRLANDGIRVVVETPGATSTGETAWDTDPDALERFGLASARGRNFLSGDKILELRQGAMRGDATNGHPDYDEVKQAFGFTDADFHLRIYPLVYGIDDARWRPYSGLDVAFIGDAEPASVTPPTVTITATQASSPSGAVAVTFTITCSSGPAEDVYAFTTRLDTGTGPKAGVIARNSYSPRVLCDGVSRSFDVRWENLDWAQGTATYVLEYDVKSMATDATLVTEATLDVTLTAGTEAFTLVAESDDWNFVTGETPTVFLDKRARDGSRWNSESVAVTAKLYAPGTPVDWAGTPDATWTGTLPKSQVAEAAFTGVSPASGTWTMIVRTDDGTKEARERFTFTSTAIAVPSFALTTHAQHELGLLRELVQNLDGDHYPAGDVFHDRKDDTMKTLAYAPHGSGVLDLYDVVVIGTNVDTQSLSGAFAEDLREWVDAGGTLIVLGNEDQGAQWMQSANAFTIHFDSASGALMSPDPTHPMLHSPDELRYKDYRNTGRTYRMTGNELTGYDHVLVDSQTQDQSNDILAVSAAGVYGKGTVVLTSLRPNDLTVPQDDHEAKKLLNNLMSRALDTLHLDYGPAIPDHSPVASATRTAVVPHPREAGLLVEVKVILYAFR